LKQHHFFRRHRVLSLLALFGILPVAVLAYFLSHGVGSTTQTVTTAGAASEPISLSVGALSGPALSPGGGADTFTVSATNRNADSVAFSLTATVKTDGTGIFDTTSGAYVDSCPASWYSATLQTGGTHILPAGSGQLIDTVTVAMPTNNGTDQSACESLTPEIDVAAS
jgi:hypothetical protein